MATSNLKINQVTKTLNLQAFWLGVKKKWEDLGAWGHALHKF